MLNVEYKNGKIETIFIKFDDFKAGLSKKRHSSNGVPIERITVDIRTNAKKDSAPAIKRTQFPLSLSWGCTVHKVQGLSLDK